VNDKPLVGYTHEGYPVQDHALCSLAFVLLAATWEGFKPHFQIALEFNKTASGSRRPYIALSAFGLLIQCGWLF
jgi:hypothetical protein